VKPVFYFLQFYVQTVDSFKINVLIRSAKLLYRRSIKNEILYPQLNTLSDLLRDDTLKELKILSLGTK